MSKQFKQRLSLVIAALLASTSVGFATDSESQEQTNQPPLTMSVMSGETTTGSAVKLVTSATLVNNGDLQTNYVMGQPLQGNLKLDVTYDDNTTEQIPVTDDMFKLSEDGSTFVDNFTTDTVKSEAVYIVYDNAQRAYIPLVVVHPKNTNIESSTLELTNNEIQKDSVFVPEGKLKVQYNSTVNNYATEYPLTEAGLSINTSSVNTSVAGSYPVTYSFAGGTTGTAYVQVVNASGEKYVTDVKLEGIKTNYIEGQDFTPQGNFKVTYSDGSEDTVPVGLQHLQFLSTNVVGNNIDARVMYDGRILSYKVNVVAKSVASIDIDTDSPIRTTYTVGTPLTTTGAQIVVNWDNGKNSKSPLTADMVSGYNPEQLGKQTLIITHEGKTTTFDITVIEAPAKIEPVSIKLIDPKTTYYKGQKLTVYTANVTMNDGSMEDVLLLPDAVTGFDSSKLGEQELTSSYTSNGVTVTAKLIVNVLEDSVVDLGVNYGHKFVMGINDFGTQNIIVRYASGKYESMQLKPENFPNLDLSKAHTAMLQLRCSGLTQMVKVEIPLPNREIDRVEQTGVVYHRLGAPLFDGTPTAIYEVYFTDGTHCKAMYDALTDDAVGNITGVPGIVYFNASLPNGDNFISCIVNTDDTSKIGMEANLTFEINNLKDVYSIGDKLGDDIFVSTLADGEEVDVTRITEDALKVEAFDTATAGQKTLIINLNNAWNLEFPYSVKDANGNIPASLKAISVKDVTELYKIGDKFDGKGSVKLHLTDDTTSYIKLSDNKVTITGLDTTTVGKKTVTVTYQGKSVTYVITVTEATSGGGSSSGGSGGGGGGGGATTPAKPAETKPTETKPATPVIPGTTKVGMGEVKLTKFTSLTAETIKQVNAFTVPTKLAEGITLPNGMKTISVEGKKPAFTDVAKHWAASSINEAVERGLLNGVSETSFSPKAPLTMEQTLVGLNNVLLRNNIIQMKMDKKDIESKLASQLENPTWSTFAVAQVLGNTNKETLDKVAANPATLKATMTRGEMANIIYTLGKDVFPTQANSAEEFCKELGIMVGDANGNFAAERQLSRAELSSILLRVDDKLAAL